MVVDAARWVAVAVGFWLMGLSVFMLTSPRRALAALGAMGGTNTVHFGEMGFRTAGGLALILAAAVSKFPVVIGVLGWFLVVTALVLMFLPRRWHAAYSTYWARRISVLAVRLIAPVSAVAGSILIWAMI